MDKKELLNYRALTLEARRLRLQLGMLERDAYQVPGGSEAVKYQDALVLYRATVAAREAQLLAIERAIDSLPAVERLVLRLRYIEGRSWARVCMAIMPLGYSERQVYRLHGSALEKLKGE